MRFAYYPGCSARSTCAELNEATHKVAGRLGLDLLELPLGPVTTTGQSRFIHRVLEVLAQHKAERVVDIRALPVKQHRFL